MQATKHFDRLIGSGFPITWTTILLAWTGFPDISTPVTKLIGADEVLRYAMDQIGSGPPAQEALVTKLAFSERTDTWTIQWCLKQLASDAPDEIQRSLRIWRWVLLDEIITDLEQRALTAPDQSAPQYGEWLDDFRTSVYCDLRDFWRDFAFPYQGFAINEDWEHGHWLSDRPNTLRLIEEHRRWLVQGAAEFHRINHNR